MGRKERGKKKKGGGEERVCLISSLHKRRVAAAIG